MIRLRWFAFATALVCAAPVGGVAVAQPSESAASARADELNRKAIELGKKDRYAEAEPLAREAWSLKQSYDIAANLGLTELALKKYRDAAEHLAYARRTFPTNGKPENKALVEQSYAKARSQVGAIVLHVDPGNADISIDSARVPVIGQPELYVTPGPHTVEAKLEGHTPASASVNAVAGGSEDLKLVCAAAPPGTPTAIVVPPPPPEGGRRVNVPLVIAGYGVAAVGVGLGVTFAVLAGGKGSDGDALQGQIAATGGPSACGAGSTNASCDQLRSDRSSRDGLSTASMISFIGGGAFAVGTTIYLLAAPRGSAPPPVSATAGPGGGSLRFSTHF